MLRDDLLSDRTIALAGPVPDGLAGALTAVGARTAPLPIDAADEVTLEQWARDHAPLHGLVYDAAPAFAGGGEATLQIAVERAWMAVRAVSVGALIADPGAPIAEPDAGTPVDGRAAGKIVLVTPAGGAGPLAGAAAAALENLARTLAVEWARYGITAATVVRGGEVANERLAELICFLVSPAGDYFSGCRLDLRAA